MVKARLQGERGKGLCPREINRINLRNDLDREDMNTEIQQITLKEINHII